MSVSLIDARARADAARAIALIEKHVAVCEERGKQEDQFQKRTEDFLLRFQSTCEAQIADIVRRIDNLRTGDVAIRGEIAAAISAATRPIDNRFWALAVALIGSLATLSGFLAAKLLGWL